MQQAGGVLKNLFQSLGIEGRLAGFKVVEYWPEIVGPVLAPRSTVKNFEAGRLTIEVVGASATQELLMMKSVLLQAFAERSGPGLVKEIQFVPSAKRTLE